MPYEVTASRKRPADFESLAGQEFVVATLKNSLTSGRIAHAYLFSGPRGVGKTSAARILAKALNCEKGPTATPCGECNQCREIAQGSALDVIEIDGASNTSVNDVREIKDEVLFAPASGRYKVYIIDEVHMLSNSAFNALLKTIEEPPPYIVFVFATTEIHKVPATIRSRCQQFNFRLIPLEVIVEKLREVCRELNLEAEEAVLLWIAKEATGSLRDAYTLFDQVISFSEGHLTMAQIQEKMGLTGFDRINTLVERLAEGKGQEAFSLFEEVMGAGVAVEQFVIELTDYYRSLLFMKQGIRKSSLLGYTEERFSPRVQELLTARQIEKALSLLFELYRNLRYSLNGRFEVELVLSRLVDLRNFLSREELFQRIQELRKELRYATQGEAGKDLHLSPHREEAAGEEESEEGLETGESSLETEIGSVSADRILTASPLNPSVLNPEQKKAIILGLKKKVTLSSTLEKSEDWRWEGDTLIIHFKSKFSADYVLSEISAVVQKVKEVLGREVEVVIRYDPPTEKPVEESVRKPDAEEDRVEIARKVFRGEIIQ
ncbi:MAG TPA: DNA polymerase III subunit gamma/tau [Spirochaetales bacterium]|nr:DNA polymerase III subunit gamma/tau [Spirochaetales bacterium]